jgi:hypothetical protein
MIENDGLVDSDHRDLHKGYQILETPGGTERISSRISIQETMEHLAAVGTLVRYVMS